MEHEHPKLSPSPTQIGRSPSSSRLASGILTYGGQFLIEVCVLFGVLIAWEIIWDQHLEPSTQLALGLFLTTVAMAAAEAVYRLYQRVWLVAGPRDTLAAALAAFQAILVITIANGLLPPYWRPFHALLPLIASPMAVIAVTAFRLVPRIVSAAPLAENRFLIVVADSSQYGTVKAVIQNPRALWSPVAIVTSDPVEVRKTVMGIPVVGEAKDLAHWIQVTRADGVAFVLQDGNPERFRELLAVALALERPVFIVPQTEEWFRSDGHSHLRQLTADDLVGRHPHETDLRLSEEAIASKTVLVTGAAGSVGSELSRILATLKPKRLVLIDNNESGLFDIAEELRNTTTVEIHEALVSVTDMDYLLSVFADERPDLVFHAAAYKHVPMLEGHPDQAVTVNVIGTANIVRCAEAAGVSQFVLISTDKAASRHSVMGCTKRLCELIVLGHKGNMQGWAVRFGNVVGSRGSVVPTFERQIRRRGPVTITHPDASRYMMTTREAAALVIATVGMAKRGQLYMLDMGEPVKILDLANALIRSRGLRPGKDIEVVFTGLRPGERLTEDLLAPDEGTRPSSHASILEVVTPLARNAADLDWTIERLRELVREQRPDELVRVLKLAVTAPTFPTDEPTVIRPQRMEAEPEGGR
jgi:FlaA1/EpsC-like NDP-sugar epimerase